MNLPDGGNQPLVSIITLNYNQAAVTAEFLESGRTLRLPEFRDPGL